MATDRPSAITGATLIDGLGGPPLADAVIVMEGGRFTRVGPRAATPVPEGAAVVAADGAYAIPGLVDMHVHIGPPEQQHLSMFTAAGVTTVLDLGGRLPDLAAARAALEAGQVAGPRLHYAGPLLEEGTPFDGFAHMSRGFAAGEVEAVVDELADAGVDAIKLYITVRPETARRAVARAHARGLRVFMHQQATTGGAAAEAGVDCLEHLMVFAGLAPEEHRLPDPGALTPFEFGGWMWRWLPDVDPEGEAVRRLYARLLAAGTALDPTLVLYAARPAAMGEDGGDMALDDPECTPLLSLLPPPVARTLQERWAERRQAAAGASERAQARTRRAWEHLLALTGGFHRAGGTIVAGTDCPNVAIVSGVSLHRELELLVRAGLTPMDALRAATRRPAELLGSAGEWGSIAPGHAADLALLGADPLADIRHTRRIRAIYAAGQPVTPLAALAGP